jgi:putative membrane protein
MTVFVIVGAVFVAVAALIHIFIFVMESVLWLRPTTYRRFGIASQNDAEVLRPMALNQGFYNLFLAIGGIVAVILLAAGVRTVGCAIGIFAVASMLAAALVLITSNPRLARAAVLQGAAPLVGVVFLILALTTA